MCVDYFEIGGQKYRRCQTSISVSWFLQDAGSLSESEVVDGPTLALLNAGATLANQRVGNLW